LKYAFALTIAGNKFLNSIKQQVVSGVRFERWFLFYNAKDIGVFYLIYPLFAGLVGTAFSVLI
jgi:hypothetical protein